MIDRKVDLRISLRLEHAIDAYRIRVGATRVQAIRQLLHEALDLDDEAQPESILDPQRGDPPT